MNAFDYFFDETSQLDKFFLVGSESITFKELYLSSLCLAKKIRAEFGQKKHILLFSANNLFFIESYLAILKSGNICIPLDPGIEKENFSYIVEKTKPVLGFCTKELAGKLPVETFPCIFPDMKLTGSQNFVDFEDENSTHVQDCAEIIFTSGSTGKPKGVMISHKNLIVNTSSILSYLNLSSNDRMLVVLPFFYCYGLSLLHTHLRIGGSIVLNNSFIFLGKIISNLIDFKCTGFAGVPSHFQMLIRKSESFKNTRFPDLKYVTQAGGGLATSIIDEFRENFPEIKFYVMYGQTEATARLSYLPPELYETKKGSIGKGIPGVELRVVNRTGEEIKPGETGEIIAHGDNIMLGYFPASECTPNLKNRWLYTGDLGTQDEDGFIYLTARKKEIIKVNGKRISPREIESIILQLPDVIDCKIEGYFEESTGESIRATVVLKNHTDENQAFELIKQHCSQHLAIYKVPHFFESVKQLTISSAGKKIKG
jgi:acyl-CoA synthetase (AMP-forming)/AMP-acid ligase II